MVRLGKNCVYAILLYLSQMGERQSNRSKSKQGDFKERSIAEARAYNSLCRIYLGISTSFKLGM